MLSKEMEAIKFFQSKNEYKRILSEIFKKYKRFGKFTGIFELKDLTEEEKRILAPLNYKYFNAKEAKISVKKFLDYFCSGKFEELDFAKVLEIYFKDDLTTYREEKEDEQRKKEEFFKELLSINKRTIAVVWLQEALEAKKFGYNILIKNYEDYNKNNKLEDFKTFLNNVLSGIDSLTFNANDLESLPIFSSRITKDPHYFDINTTAGKILIHAICYRLRIEFPKDAEETAEVLYSAGLSKDDVSSYIATFGLRAYRGKIELKFMYGFTEIGEPLIITLGNLSKIDKVICNKNRLFIFENPSLFSEIIKRTGEFKPSILCTSGQLKLASVVLLDKIVENVEEIYYSGDFDPEGIAIADKLKIRYGDKLKFWRFDVEDYLKIISNKAISSIRMSKLRNIKNAELEPLIQEIKKNGMAGYQELLIEEYIEDIWN
ncbi:TIGR02679 domain-containing protein [Clostridium algifaecis]|nr:TIGR02679 domain-containing protein [Clostridium algifaecis]